MSLCRMKSSFHLRQFQFIYELQAVLHTPADWSSEFPEFLHKKIATVWSVDAGNYRPHFVPGLCVFGIHENEGITGLSTVQNKTPFRSKSSWETSCFKPSLTFYKKLSWEKFLWFLDKIKLIFEWKGCHYWLGSAQKSLGPSKTQNQYSL